MTAKAGKRFLSLVLALAMILSLGAVPVQATEKSGTSVCQVGEDEEAYFDSIVEAVAYINEKLEGEGTITLLTNVVESVTIESGTITVDMNGCTWACTNSSTSDYPLVIKGGAIITLENGTIGTGHNGVRIYASGDESSPSKLVVAEDAVVIGDTCGIDMWGSEDDSTNGDGLEVVVNGTVTLDNPDYEAGSTIIVRRDITSGSASLVINGTVTGGNYEAGYTDGCGVAVYGWADVTVNEGASISGATGIEMRAGSLTVNGGEITSTADSFEENTSTGTSMGGAGIAIDENTADLNITVTISGGTISGYYAIAEANTRNNDNHVTVTITGGTFTSIDENVDVYIESEEGMTVEVSCGEFSNVESVEDYLADGAVIYGDFVHTMDDGVVTDPTCVDDGYTTYTCPYCGESFTADPTDATGNHTYGDWVVTKKATSTTDGEMQCVCEVCGDTVTVTIPAGSSEKEVEEITKTVTETVEVPVEKIVTKTETKTVTKTVTEEKEVEVPGETVVVTKEVKVTESGEEIPTTKSHILRVTGTSKSTSVTLKWNKIENADGYIIYGAPCGKVMKKLKTIKSGSTLTWKNTNLKKGTSYKYVVKAYKTVGSTKVVLKSGNEVHVATTNGKFTNVKKVKLDSSIKNITLKAGKTKTISTKKVSVTLNNSRKSLKKCANFIKFRSNNTKIAKVTKAGKITAKKAGSCLIYVYAGDGQYAKIHLTVK